MARINIEWAALEDRLFDLTAADIRKFAAAHRKESFYGFALDCNSKYGNVLLCLNTADDLRQAAVQYSTNPPNFEFRRKLHEKLGLKPPTLKTSEEEEKELRWSLGDWKYQGFNSKEFDDGWRPFESAVLNACSDEEEDAETFMTPTQRNFMEAACRVMVRLEAAGAFDNLNRTSEFKTWVADHDESDERAWERLERVRSEFSGS